MIGLGAVLVAASGVFWSTGTITAQQATYAATAGLAAAIAGAALWIFSRKSSTGGSAFVLGNGDGPEAGQDINAGGDIVGRNKISAGGDVVGQNKITYIAGGAKPTTSPILQVLTPGVLRDKDRVTEAFFDGVRVKNRNPDELFEVRMVLALTPLSGAVREIEARRFGSLDLPLGEAGSKSSEATGNAIFPIGEEYVGQCEIRLLDSEGEIIVSTATEITELPYVDRGDEVVRGLDDLLAKLESLMNQAGRADPFAVRSEFDPKLAHWKKEALRFLDLNFREDSGAHKSLYDRRTLLESGSAAKHLQSSCGEHREALEDLRSRVTVGAIGVKPAPKPSARAQQRVGSFIYGPDV